MNKQVYSLEVRQIAASKGMSHAEFESMTPDQALDTLEARGKITGEEVVKKLGELAAK